MHNKLISHRNNISRHRNDRDIEYLSIGGFFSNVWSEVSNFGNKTFGSVKGLFDKKEKPLPLSSAFKSEGFNSDGTIKIPSLNTSSSGLDLSKLNPFSKKNISKASNVLNNLNEQFNLSDKGLEGITNALHTELIDNRLIRGGAQADEDTVKIDTLKNTMTNIASKFGPWGQLAAGGINIISSGVDSLFGTKLKGDNKLNSEILSTSTGFGNDLRTHKEESFRSGFLGGHDKAKADNSTRALQRSQAAKIITDSKNLLALSNQTFQNNTINDRLRKIGGFDPSLLRMGKSGIKIDYSFLEKVKTLQLSQKQENLKTTPLFKDGGKMNPLPDNTKMNVIPDGAFHSRKHNIEDKNISDNVTKKGIPVIIIDNDEVTQTAEVEKNEIIFTKEITEKLEKLAKENTVESQIEAGKLLVQEILYNTIDNTGLINKIN